MKNLFIAIAGMTLALSPVAVYAHCGTCDKGEAKEAAAKCEKCTDEELCADCKEKCAAAKCDKCTDEELCADCKKKCADEKKKCDKADAASASKKKCCPAS